MIVGFKHRYEIVTSPGKLVMCAVVNPKMFVAIEEVNGLFTVNIISTVFAV